MHFQAEVKALISVKLMQRLCDDLPWYKLHTGTNLLYVFLIWYDNDSGHQGPFCVMPPKCTCHWQRSSPITDKEDNILFWLKRLDDIDHCTTVYH